MNKKLITIVVLIGILLTNSLYSQEILDTLNQTKQVVIKQDTTNLDYSHVLYIIPIFAQGEIGAWFYEPFPSPYEFIEIDPDNGIGFSSTLLCLFYEYRFHQHYNFRIGLLYTTYSSSRVGSFYINSFLNINAEISYLSKSIRKKSPVYFEASLSGKIAFGLVKTSTLFIPGLRTGIRFTPKDSWYVIRAGVYLDVPLLIESKASAVLGVYWNFGFKF